MRPPRELLLDGLAEALEMMPDAELRLVKSGPLLRRSNPDPDFSEVIRFEGCKWNKAGEAAEYRMIADISSKKLRRWRAQFEHNWKWNASGPGGGIALKIFSDPLNSDEYYSWKFGPFVTLISTIRRLADNISGEILPWFHLCREAENFSLLEGTNISGFMDFALMQGKRDVSSKIAQKSINEIVKRHEMYIRTHGVDLTEQFGLRSKSVEELLASKNSVCYLLGFVRLHNLDVKWPGL